MAMLNNRLILKVMYEVFVLAVLVPFCLSTVENCRPCRPGEYCSKFFGICLACKDYCPGESDCPSACSPIKPNLTTFAPTTTTPTSIQIQTTSQSMTTSTSSGDSAVVVQPSTNANIPSRGDNTLSDNGKEISELHAWLVVCLFITLCIVGLLIVLCLKYRKTLKISSVCCFSSGDSENGTEIELDERPRSNSCHQATGGYTAVHVDDVAGHDIINQPGPSQPNTSRPSRLPRPNAEAAAPGDPTHSASGSGKNCPYQTASVRSSKNPQREIETPQGACPSDRRSSPKRTSEIHRKQTDGTHDGHEITTGASPFNPPNGMCEDIQWESHSGHGD